MPKQSAGLVLYLFKQNKLQVLLVHPGGPFWVRKDEGAWSIPKGEAQTGEELIDAAKREVSEETAGTLMDISSHLIPSARSQASRYMDGPCILIWMKAL